MASHAEQYFNPPGVHPSLPNYLWLEAGAAFGIRDDKDPSANHQPTDAHLVTLLEQAGISRTSYQEDIDGLTCPLTRTDPYAPKHNPMIYFDDVTDGNNPTAARYITHVRPMSELTVNLMHNTSGCASRDSIPNLTHACRGATSCPTALHEPRDL